MSVRDRIATPDGKRRYVRVLFATIADRYDFITSALSYGQDRRWKRRLVDLAAPRPGVRALDLATGTGDIAFALAARGARVVGLDITFRMIELARAKGARAEAPEARRRQASDRVSAESLPPPLDCDPTELLRESPKRLRRESGALHFLQGDMLALPFPAGSFDIVTTGYGLRNVTDLTMAIDEIARVLAPRGQVLSLDFDRPSNRIVRSAYLSYLTVVGAALGWILHRDPDTYRYIPASIRQYPGADAVARLFEARGFSSVRWYPVLGGLMTIHHASRT
jgi:demethylmenaquinone methyltransferase/2-methoxy-6-polyprenyl-1,4-benzoquinol methylase